MDIDLMDDADEGFQKCQSGDIFGTPCDAMAETIVEVMPRHLRALHEAADSAGRYPSNGALRLSVCPYCAGDLVESEGGVELECEDGMDGELHAVDHVHPEDRKAALTSAIVCIAAFVAEGIR